jgi:hypothetical protein
LIWTGTRLLTPQGRVIGGLIWVGSQLAGAETPPSDGIDPLELRRRRLNGEDISGQGSTTQVVPADPNDIVGPDGFGAELHRQPGGTYGYTIRFQNKPEASAPAQEVVVTQQLDPDLDWDSFRLDAFGWAGLRFDAPAGARSHFVRLNDPASGLVVEVDVRFDAATGDLAWTFRSLDPVSLDTPADALAGFLPPDDATGRGQGFVSYTIQPRAGASTGTRYDAQASIIFDTEAPILTNVHVNTIDNTAPTADVAPLPALSPASFVVRWSGVDAGSGIRSYDVLVKEGDAPWRTWLDDTSATSATFVGFPGVTYAFEVLATDGVGLHSPGSTTIASTRVDVPDRTPTPPRIDSFVINQGERQRSRVRSIELTFSTLVGVDPQAFRLTRRNGRSVGLDVATSQNALGQTVVRIAFRGPLTTRRSLRDGLHNLLVRAGSIRDTSGVALDGDDDGRPGGAFTAPLHRLFGDTNGNGRIDRSDREAMSLAIARRRATPETAHLDANLDGRLQATDLRAFQARLTKRIPAPRTRPEPRSR